MIYLIPGLGADERVFQGLRLPQPFKILKWAPPADNEKLSSYCQKLIFQIDTQQEIILIGISFGGIVAQEIASLFQVKLVILVSGVQDPKEIPMGLRIAGFLRLHHLIPFQYSFHFSRLNNWLFTTRTGKEEKLLKEILKDTPPAFVKWALQKVLEWRPDQTKRDKLYRIHGGRDKIFPVRMQTNIDKEIPEGGHFLIVTDAELIQNYIKKLLSL